ncbi:ABC transporter ATP-binding protein [Sanguibacter sp. HDW7]|uniref:ABC transporter ATP-binding protein n=1 Tax=Sanguibacter sp. HDW7 TaxID=2714931 RepID=UPI001408CA97|nr:ABC transporter ATP-binding protein [Sanguibacter sp. HDW7]QIK83352.1 ABC transporter ATP-binding protein [Sanguibacter sp. HDW7]
MSSSADLLAADVADGTPIPGQGEPLVDVRGLTVSLGGREVLGDVDLTVRDGELVAVLGASGCGKSTLLRVLAGLEPRVARVAADVLDVPRTGGARDVAWMPQHDALLPWRRALGNVVLGGEVRRLPRAERRERAAVLLARFGLADSLRAWPHELSGGMRQRVAVARTVLAGRRLLLLDEPFGALDALTRRRTGAWLDEERRTGGLGRTRAVVLVTHDVEEAVALADRVAVLGGSPAGVVAVADVAELGVSSARRTMLASL